MKTKILNKLSDIEKDKNIEILFAVESVIAYSTSVILTSTELNVK